MKAKQTYLKGKSIFKVSLMVIAITMLTVYSTGENFNRTVTSNLYLSLTIIGAALFLFMTYGLYKGIGITDDFPKFNDFKTGDLISNSGTSVDLPDIDVSEGIQGIILSIFLWIVMTIAAIILLFVLEAVFWISIFIILGMLYWVFFRALKLVFTKASETKDNLGISAMYSLGYTALYLGWIFGIVYLSEILS